MYTSNISDIESGEKIPSFNLLVNIMRVYHLNWPERQTFFSKALKSFNGNMAFQIKNGIIPDDLLCNFIGCYLAASGENFSIEMKQQAETTLKCIDRIRQSLKKITNPPYVDLGDKHCYDPLPKTEPAKRVNK